MASLNGFDANKVEPTSFEPIPAGKYLAAIIDSETKLTKAGTGSYLALTFEILETPYKGRQVFARLNLENPSPKAVQIAQGELSAICRAVGVLKPKDSLELHNLPLIIKVKVKKREDNEELTNEIRGYEKKETVVSSQTTSAPWKK
jgi:predicted DNA-binding antitoxin AbrB/MazE fold protein